MPGDLSAYRGHNKGTKLNRMTPIHFANMFAELLRPEGTTVKNTAEITGLHITTVGNYFRALHEHQPKIIYIADYEADARGRRQTLVFKFGDKPDAKKRRVTGKQRAAKYRERQRQLREQAKIGQIADELQRALYGTNTGRQSEGQGESPADETQNVVVHACEQRVWPFGDT